MAVAPASRGTGKVVETVTSLTGVRVLIVDDEPDIRDILAEALRLAGAAVRAAPSARGALAVLDVDPADVIVTDLAMPREDGYWLLAEIRRRHPGRAVIALTGHLADHQRPVTLGAGFTDMLTKPVEFEALRAAVARAASRRR